MNMKKTIYTVIATLLFLISSCTLEQEVYNKINPGMFPQNAEDVNALVNSSAYYVFSPWGIFEVAAGYVTTSEMVTDYVENTWGWTTVYNSYEANDWHIDGDYRRVYDYCQYLASMTLTMERIKNVDMDETLKARYMAELKCGRGFLAFLMYDMYGPIPIADLETLQKPEAEIVIPRLSEEAMREYIVTNLKEAADILPYKYEDTDYGRFTKGLANTLLLKFYMMTKQWDEAEKIGRELTKSEYGYKLVDDYHSLFSLSGEKNSEVIFSCVAEAGVMEQKWFAHVLTSDYPIPAGMAVTAWGGYKISWPAYESFDPKDKRRERIIGEYTGTEGVHHSRALDRDGGTTGVLFYGAIPVKYKIEGVIGELCEIDMPIYRYADVLTLLSEAIVRNGNSITQEAVGLLNQVRVTHGGLKAYQLSDFASVEDFLDKLLEERGHEFYFEGVRRQDLIRHGKFIEAALAKARFAGQPTGKIETKVDGQYKYEKFPLPTHLITEGQGLIIQNPGY